MIFLAEIKVPNTILFIKTDKELAVSNRDVTWHIGSPVQPSWVKISRIMFLYNGIISEMSRISLNKIEGCRSKANKLFKSNKL
jgi:hypothetical protein